MAGAWVLARRLPGSASGISAGVQEEAEALFWPDLVTKIDTVDVQEARTIGGGCGGSAEFLPSSSMAGRMACGVPACTERRGHALRPVLIQNRIRNLMKFFLRGSMLQLRERPPIRILARPRTASPEARVHRPFVLLTTLLLAGSSLRAQPALARTPLTVSSSSLPASQQPLSTPSFVVNTNQDDAGTTYSQCGATTGPGTCTLRDALAAAQNAGAGNITFDAAVFASSNDAAANAIVLANGVLNVPGSTSVTGPTPTVVNGLPTPVVTVSGNQHPQFLRLPAPRARQRPRSLT